MGQRVVFVDVFTARRYAGNPLAVVIGDGLPDATMQRIAAEFNFSETTFVAPQPAADVAWPVRIFTPARELAFAGHPILGTAWVLRDQDPRRPPRFGGRHAARRARLIGVTPQLEVPRNAGAIGRSMHEQRAVRRMGRVAAEDARGDQRMRIHVRIAEKLVAVGHDAALGAGLEALQLRTRRVDFV